MEGIAAAAITRSGGINTDGRALSTGITSGTNDGTVTGNQVGEGKKADGVNDLVLHFDCWVLGLDERKKEYCKMVLRDRREKSS